MGATAQAVATWKAPTVVATALDPSIALDTAPVVVLDRRGNAAMAWVDCIEPPPPSDPPGTCGSHALYVSTRRGRAGSAWSAARMLTASVGRTTVGLESDRRGRFYVIWLDMTDPGFEKVLVASRRPGRPWSQPTTLSKPSVRASNPNLAVNQRGDMIVVWQEGSTIDAIPWYRTKNAGGTWSSIKRASGTDQAGGNGVNVGMDGSGAAAIVYAAEDEGVYRAFARRRVSRSSNFGPPVALSTTAAEWYGISELQAAVHDGHILASWVRLAGTSYTFEGRERRRGASWRPVRDIDGSSDGILSFGGRDVSDSGHGAFVWMRASDSQLRGRKRLGFGRWTQPRSWATIPGELGNGGVVEVGPTGKVFAAFQSMGSSGRRIYTSVSRSGSAGWGSAAPITQAGETYRVGNVASDPHGNAVVALLRTTSGNAFEVAAYDGAGPFLARLRVPRRRHTNERIRFSVSPYDVWSKLGGRTQWRFGDGDKAFGNRVRHSYDEPGTYVIRVTRRDKLGNRTTVRKRIRITV